MLNIGRGRRREHPKDTSEGVTWPSVTTGVAQLPVAHAHTQGNLERVKYPSVTCGSHVTTVLLQRKKRGGNRACAEHTSGQGLFWSREFVTSGQKAPLGRILCNFWLRMRKTYLRTGHVTDVTSGHVTDVTFGHVTSGPDPPQIWLELCPYTSSREYNMARSHRGCVWIEVNIVKG